MIRVARNNKGDTIVEVLIAIAISGLILAGSFVSANRSSQITRTAQERGEALKIAEAQVERIRIGAATLPAPPFCFKADGSLGGTPTCGIQPYGAGGLTYTAGITGGGGTNSYKIIVTWEALRGGINTVELGYQTQ